MMLIFNLRTAKIVALAALVTLVCSAKLLTAEESDFAGSYFCTAEAIGGVRFNEQANRWESYRFAPNRRYVINLTLFGEVESRFNSELRSAYIISITEHGANDAVAVRCPATNDQLRSIDPFIHFIRFDGSVSCNFTAGEWRMNLSNGRYLYSHTWGYTSGLDSNLSTPAVEIGLCSRIQ
jgi:hypothetical protein